MAVASTVAFMSAAPLRVAEPAPVPRPAPRPVADPVADPFADPAVRSPYRPPVDAEVTTPFDMRAGRYGAGNRGLDYDTPPGTDVAAIGDGTVVFAGAVAGRRWITVLHRDGLRSTYGPLDRLDVTRGSVVARGERLGTTAGVLHLGVRDGDEYVDPAALFDRRRPHARLVARRAGPRRGYTHRSA